MKVYVVTNPERGWDCVVGVYTSEEVARKEYPNEDTYIIHAKTLVECNIEDYEEECDELEEPEETHNEWCNRKTREKFDSIIKSSKNEVSISTNHNDCNGELLRQLLEYEGFKVSYAGKYGFTMVKQ